MWLLELNLTHHRMSTAGFRAPSTEVQVCYETVWICWNNKILRKSAEIKMKEWWRVINLLLKYSLIIQIQKPDIKFYKDLQSSDPHSYQYKALQCQELNKDKSPLCQLVLKLCPHTPGLQDRHQTIWPNSIISKQQEDDIKYWNQTTESQSKLELYLTLKREYMVAEYLTTVTDRKLRKTLTDWVDTAGP